MDTTASDFQPTGSRSPFSPRQKERRPFLKLAPLVVPHVLPRALGDGLEELEYRVGEEVQTVVRSLVNFTVAQQIVQQRVSGKAIGVSIGVLNRRRRAAREWILSILAGGVDVDTLHRLTRSWIPQLAGTGPDVRDAVEFGQELIEFVRGAMTALVMSEIAPSLVPHAKALNALETVLAIHLKSIREAADRPETPE